MSGDEATFAIGERAKELMRTYSVGASPRCYELWFTYAMGASTELNLAVKQLLDSKEKLSEADTDALHADHIPGSRIQSEAMRAGDGLLGEMRQVTEMIGVALDTAERYGESLRAVAADLGHPSRLDGIRDIIETLVVATRDVATTNHELETNLRSSRGEIDKLRQTLESVRQETLVDALTGLANRKHFEETLVSAVASARESGEPLALIVIDIDRFKHFNDVYGHLTGDQVLRLISSAMRENVDPRATLARFGGEEFAVILPRSTREQAFDCAETVRRSVETRELVKRSTNESLGRITVSLGIATLEAGDNATSLLERADDCMYRAKRAGRNRTVTDMSDERTAVGKAA